MTPEEWVVEEERDRALQAVKDDLMRMGGDGSLQKDRRMKGVTPQRAKDREGANMNLAEMGVAMVLKALPEQVKKKLVANRQLSMVTSSRRWRFATG